MMKITTVDIVSWLNPGFSLTISGEFIDIIPNSTDIKWIVKYGLPRIIVKQL